MNSDLFYKYIKEYIIPILQGRPSLFVLDLCSAHKTEQVLQLLHSHEIIPSLIPPGCTNLVQLLDVSVNKTLKERIRELTDEAILEYESVESFEKWSVSQRRILTTNCVGDAWYLFCLEKKKLVENVFRKVGLSLPADGSKDDELNIKGFEVIEIGDWKIDGKEVEAILYNDIPIAKDNNDAIEFIANGE
ncbi:hypothetical protein L873DRAFT_1845917 [Choiromyces venosus 120613-1]|uniref:DDE-1 domain-containing protein n=1 Tax=Choiromyces venosus 120613-1 TaxID=1336337 RepID=A0A3N4JBJ3_9PEZI|nr:hypothetical protein L873DRAFT_1845917 [Choiromyces venosus 120613-1]